jgi:catechol 2,3-dioxygenase-like lactoylglutathione lyase family enzyme
VYGSPMANSGRPVFWVSLLSLLGLLGSLGCTGENESPLALTAEACHGRSELSCPRPIFNVHHLQRSLRYYRDALGFKVDWQYGQPPDFASVSRGEAVFFLCQGCQGSPGGWAMIFARDVEALHRELAAKAARIRMPPKKMPWGLREMHVADHDGNVIRFATAIKR